MTENKPNPESDQEPKLRVDLDALGRAFLKGLQEAAEEEEAMPKQFEIGECMHWPLSD